MPVRAVSTSAPSFASEAEYSNAVFYPEPEVEVGEAAPSFSLPGAACRCLIGLPSAADCCKLAWAPGRLLTCQAAG